MREDPVPWETERVCEEVPQTKCEVVPREVCHKEEHEVCTICHILGCSFPVKCRFVYTVWLALLRLPYQRIS